MCSCCYADGCWICDAHTYADGRVVPQNVTDAYCHWESKMSTPGQTAPIAPGGGVLEPASKPRLPFTPKVAPRGSVGGAIGPAQ
jgi:hypothetical protein